jgi:geranylgeranyl diphosphate synthase type I
MKQILSYNEVIRSKLEAFIRAKHSEASPDSPWKTDFLERLLPFATTGKLLRGSLVCFSYQSFAGKPPGDSVIKAALALELAHSALLIHDDIMDDDAVRRGRPSLHQQYQSLAVQEKLAQPEHFGANMAMCAGDAALFLAFELLNGSQAAARQLFTDQLVTTCAGQMQDLYLEARSTRPSKKMIYQLMETKTAAYTVGLPLAMGAVLAKETDATIRQLQAIGNNTGIIFQIRDDELGVMGNAQETGKPVGSDITEGKKTLLHYYLLKRCSASERLKIQTIFGNPEANSQAIRYIQILVERRGVTELLNNEISRLEKQTLVYIQDLEVSEKTKKELAELVRFCGNRQS